MDRLYKHDGLEEVKEAINKIIDEIKELQCQNKD